MAWTAPKTWTSETLEASDMNTHIRDNLLALKGPPSAHYDGDEGTDYTTTSSSFVDVDDTEGKFKHTITTYGGDVMVHFTGVLANTSGGRTYMTVEVDGVPLGGDQGFIGKRHDTTALQDIFTFTRLLELEAGEHVFKLQWFTSAGTETLYAGAGTSQWDFEPQFWVREVS